MDLQSTPSGSHPEELDQEGEDNSSQDCWNDRNPPNRRAEIAQDPSADPAPDKPGHHRTQQAVRKTPRDNPIRDVAYYSGYHQRNQHANETQCDPDSDNDNREDRQQNENSGRFPPPLCLRKRSTLP
jgi:hypothetical protein